MVNRQHSDSLTCKIQTAQQKFHCVLQREMGYKFEILPCRGATQIFRMVVIIGVLSLYFITYSFTFFKFILFYNSLDKKIDYNFP